MSFTKSVPRNALLLAGISAAALTAGPAHAAAITETETFNFFTPLHASNNNPDAETSSGTVTFDKFNPALGTLTQVDIELISRVTGNVSASGFGTGTAEASSELDIDLNVDVDGLGPSVFTFSLSPTAHCSRTGLCFDVEDFDQPFNDLFTVPTDGGALASFQGALATFDVDLGGQYALSCTVVQGSSCISNANVNWRNLTALGQVKVTYTYEPAGAVPEPATLALFGLGMAGLWLTRRKQAASSS